MKIKFNTVLEYLLIVLMAMFMALNYQLFIVMNHYAPAGLNGIATMVQYKTGFSIGYFSLLINIPLCLIAYFTLNKKYAIRTLTYSVFYTLFYQLLGKMNLSGIQYNANGINSIFPVLLSGVISGIVYCVLFYNSSSTGGTDVISRVISTKKENLNFFWVTFTLNLFVAITSFFVYAVEDEKGNLVYDYLPVCLCVTYCFVSSFVGDYFLKGTKKACEFTIISEQADEIRKRINEELHHGCTVYSAIGGYSGSQKTVLICVVNNNQISEMKRILSEYNNTFSYSKNVTETIGNFNKIR